MFDVKPDRYEGKPLDRQLIDHNDVDKGINASYRGTFNASCAIPLICQILTFY